MILPALQTKTAHFISAGEKDERLIGQADEIDVIDVSVELGLDSITQQFQKKLIKAKTTVTRFLIKHSLCSKT